MKGLFSKKLKTSKSRKTITNSVSVTPFSFDLPFLFRCTDLLSEACLFLYVYIVLNPMYLLSDTFNKNSKLLFKNLY